MRNCSSRLYIIGPLLAVTVLLCNARCGEYLFLHYLLTQNCCAPGITPAADSAKTDQLPTTPAVVVEYLPAVIVEDPNVEAVPTDGWPRPPVQQPACQDGDLNKDGKVDALDIQFMVNCLVSQ